MSGHLSTLQEADAISARTLGREARNSASNGNRSPLVNKFPLNSFHAYCWLAGYKRDDVRNVIELHRDWLAESKQKTP